MGIEPIGTCFADKLLAISSPFVKISAAFFDSIHKKAQLAERAGLRANAAEHATCGRAGPVVFRQNQPTRANTGEPRPSAGAGFGVGFAGSSGGERTLRFRLLAVPSARTGNRKLKTLNRVLGHKKSPASRARPGCGISSGRNSGSGPFPDRASPALAPISAGIQNAKSFGVLVALHRRKWSRQLVF